MSKRYFFSGGVDNYSATVGNWSDVTGGPSDGGGPPGAGDEFILDADSPNITISGAVSCDDWTCASVAGHYTGAMTLLYGVTLDGALETTGGCSIAGGAGDIISTSATGGRDIKDVDFTGYAGDLKYKVAPQQMQGLTNPPDLEVDDAGGALTSTVDVSSTHYAVGDLKLISCTFDCNGVGLICGAIPLGKSDGTRSATLQLGEGTHAIAGAVAEGHADCSSVLTFETSCVNLGASASIDGTGLTCTAGGAQVCGGTISNITLVGTQRLIAHGVLDGGDNSEAVEFCPRDNGMGIGLAI